MQSLLYIRYVFGHGGRKGAKNLKDSMAFVYGLGSQQSIIFTKNLLINRSS